MLRGSPSLVFSTQCSRRSYHSGLGGECEPKTAVQWVDLSAPADFGPSPAADEMWIWYPSGPHKTEKNGQNQLKLCEEIQRPEKKRRDAMNWLYLWLCVWLYVTLWAVAITSRHAPRLLTYHPRSESTWSSQVGENKQEPGNRKHIYIYIYTVYIHMIPIL